MKRLQYFRRIFAAYFTQKKSQLTFWHGKPLLNQYFVPGELGPYYMPFYQKADYSAHTDDRGIPILDYHGEVGLQYNPIAIAQYGLGNYNLHLKDGESSRFDNFISAAQWLVDNLEKNQSGLWVWSHHFDWEYRDTLKAPWYSALSQGQGISLLLRAHKETQHPEYREVAQKAFQAFKAKVDEGGVVYEDNQGNLWLEEAIVDPPTHILNGFLWALWGIYDYQLHFSDQGAERLFKECLKTLEINLPTYDIGFWSLYEHSGTRLKMIASPFYHSLHIVQLRVMYRLTTLDIFRDYADKWENYSKRIFNRYLALLYKIAFKLLYY